MKTTVSLLILLACLCYFASAQAQDNQTSDTPSVYGAEPKPFSRNQQRLHLSLGLGNVALQGNSGSVIEDNYGPSASLQLGVSYENPISNEGSLETGLAFLFLSSKLKGATSTNMNLFYLGIPVMYKHIVSQVQTKSSYYLKGGLTPLILLDASVDSCDSVACGIDDDLDSWLIKSRSVSDSFQKYSLLGTVGVGLNCHLFSDIIVDSMWLNADLSYVQGLTSINRGNELGKEVIVSGAQLSLGLAATF